MSAPAEARPSALRNVGLFFAAPFVGLAYAIALPFEPDGDMLATGTVFACPSVYEPLGIVNLEAMACETAVVATATALAERFRKGGAPVVLVHVGFTAAEAPSLDVDAPDGIVKGGDPLRRLAFGLLHQALAEAREGRGPRQNYGAFRTTFG